MSIIVSEKNKIVTNLLNSTIVSIKNVIPLEADVSKPSILNSPLKLKFGVIIGITGDLKGNLVLTGDNHVFEKIGESMFGMPISSDMLISFSGELGNMIAGGLSTNIAISGIETDISAPTIMEGNTTLSGFSKAIALTFQYDTIGDLKIQLLLD